MRVTHLLLLTGKSCPGCFPLRAGWRRPRRRESISVCPILQPQSAPSSQDTSDPCNAQFCPVASAPCTHSKPHRLCEHSCWPGSSRPWPWGEAVYFWFPNNSCFQELPAKGRGREAATNGLVQGQPREEAELWSTWAVCSRAGRGTSATPSLVLHLHQLTPENFPLLNHSSEGSEQES